MSKTTPPSPEEIKRQRRILIALMVLFAGVFLVLGALEIWNAQYFGKTKQGVDIALEGAQAQWTGLVRISIGMLMLMVVMPSKKAALRWAFAWVAFGALSLFFALRS